MMQSYRVGFGLSAPPDKDRIARRVEGFVKYRPQGDLDLAASVILMLYSVMRPSSRSVEPFHRCEVFALSSPTQHVCSAFYDLIRPH